MNIYFRHLLEGLVYGGITYELDAVVLQLQNNPIPGIQPIFMTAIVGLLVVGGKAFRDWWGKTFTD